MLRQSKKTRLLDLADRDVIGTLCESHEPLGRLFIAGHAFVQIDNELMFLHATGTSLRASPWVTEDAKRIRPSGLDEAIRLCKQVLSLTDDVHKATIRMLEGYSPLMPWSVRRQIWIIRPRAQDFLEWAAVHVNTSASPSGQAAWTPCRQSEALHRIPDRFGSDGYIAIEPANRVFVKKP